MFDAELGGLRNLIDSAEKYCRRHAYNMADTAEFVDCRCKKYCDIIVPFIASYRELYNSIVEVRPSFSAHLDVKINEYYSSRQSEDVIENDLKIILQEMNIFQDAELNKFSCVQIMVGKHGFSPELIQVINRDKPELHIVLLRYYDMKLNAEQRVQDTPENSWDR